MNEIRFVLLSIWSRVTLDLNRTSRSPKEAEGDHLQLALIGSAVRSVCVRVAREHYQRVPSD